MHRATALSRAALGALMALVAVLGLTAIPAAAADTEVDFRLPDVTAGDARVEVNPGTAIYSVEVVWPLSAPFDCTDPAHVGAQLRWRLFQDRAPSYASSGLESVCNRNDTTVTEVRHIEPVKSFQPDAVLTVWGEVDRAAVKNPDPGTVPTKINNSPTGSIRLPKPPVWIGAGDGYTSGVWQDPPVCTVANTACVADNASMSWVVSTIDRLRNDTGVTQDSPWDFEYVNVAARVAKAGDLKPGGVQAAQLAAIQSELDARAPVAGQAGSWNWVGVTGGLVDSGITTALSSWYAANTGFSNNNGANPWITQGGTWSCPSYGTVPTTVGTNATAIQDGLLNVVATAMRHDPNVRVVHPLYPNIVDGTLTTTAAINCRTAAVNAISALNGAVNQTALANRRAATNRTDLSAAELGRIYEIPMVNLYNDPQPTGSPAGILDNGSLIQLAKPWGYPYPSDGGSLTMGNAAVDVVSGLVDVGPPAVEAVVTADNPKPNEPAGGWYRGPVTVKWRVTDPADGSQWFVPGPHLTADGQYDHIWSPEPDAVDAICSASSGQCAAAKDISGLLIDSKPPVPGVKYYDPASNAEVSPTNGWFNKPVTVRWVALNDNESTAVGGVVSGPVAGQAPEVTISNNGKDQPLGTKQLCDNAGNCASLAASLSYDSTVPTVTFASTPAVPAGGWFNKANAASLSSVAATWTASDSLSGFLNGTTPTASKVVSSTIAVSADGTYPLAGPPTFTDQAGNSTVGTTFKVDRTDPTVKLLGGPSLASQAEITNGASLSNLSVFTCTAADTGSGLVTTTANPAGCTATLVTSVPATGGALLTYKVTATDVAGNTATGTYAFTSLGAASDVVPPVITLAGRTAGARYLGSAVPAATCSGTDPTPGSGFKECSVETVSSVPLPAFGPPGTQVTIRATGKDFAGNIGVSAPITYTVFDIAPKTTGAITGKGVVLAYPSASEFSLQCGAGTNQLDLAWWIGTFDLTSVDKVYCWDDARYSEGNPDAPIDSLWLVGKGKLLNGRPATIELTLTDQGEPGRGRDSLSYVVKDEHGVVVLSSIGKLAGGGNVQAGTSRRANDNDGYDGAGYDSGGHDHEGYGRDGYADDGYDRDDCDRNGYDRNRVKRKAAWQGYGRDGRDRDGFDRDGFDRNGFSRSGYDKKGYDEDGYNRAGFDRDGFDRNGEDANGVKRRSGKRG